MARISKNLGGGNESAAENADAANALAAELTPPPSLQGIVRFLGELESRQTPLPAKPPTPISFTTPQTMLRGIRSALVPAPFAAPEAHSLYTPFPTASLPLAMSEGRPHAAPNSGEVADFLDWLNRLGELRVSLPSLEAAASAPAVPAVTPSVSALVGRPALTPPASPVNALVAPPRTTTATVAPPTTTTPAPDPYATYATTERKVVPRRSRRPLAAQEAEEADFPGESSGERGERRLSRRRTAAPSHRVSETRFSEDAEAVEAKRPDDIIARAYRPRRPMTARPRGRTATGKAQEISPADAPDKDLAPSLVSEKLNAFNRKLTQFNLFGATFAAGLMRGHALGEMNALSPASPFAPPLLPPLPMASSVAPPLPMGAFFPGATANVAGANMAAMASPAAAASIAGMPAPLVAAPGATFGPMMRTVAPAFGASNATGAAPTFGPPTGADNLYAVPGPAAEGIYTVPGAEGAGLPLSRPAIPLVSYLGQAPDAPEVPAVTPDGAYPGERLPLALPDTATSAESASRNAADGFRNAPVSDERRAMPWERATPTNRDNESGDAPANRRFVMNRGVDLTGGETLTPPREIPAPVGRREPMSLLPQTDVESVARAGRRETPSANAADEAEPGDSGLMPAGRAALPLARSPMDTRPGAPEAELPPPTNAIPGARANADGSFRSVNLTPAAPFVPATLTLVSLPEGGDGRFAGGAEGTPAPVRGGIYAGPSAGARESGFAPSIGYDAPGVSAGGRESAIDPLARFGSAPGSPALISPMAPEARTRSRDSGDGTSDAAYQQGKFIEPKYGQMTIIAPPLTVASIGAEQSGAVAQMDWRTLAQGAGTLDAGGMARLSAGLPPGARAIYPALPEGAGGPNAANLALAPTLVADLLTSGYNVPGTAASVFASEASSRARTTVPTVASAAPLPAKIAPASQRPAGQTMGLLGGDKPDDHPSGALQDAGAGSAKRGGAMDFLGMPVRLAPSLGGRSELAQEKEARTPLSETPASALRPAAFGPLRERVFPAFHSVHAEPDAGAWRKAAPSFGMRDASSTTLLSPEARAPKVSDTSPLPQKATQAEGGAPPASSRAVSPLSFAGSPPMAIAAPGAQSLSASRAASPFGMARGGHPATAHPDMALTPTGPHLTPVPYPNISLSGLSSGPAATHIPIRPTPASPSHYTPSHVAPAPSQSQRIAPAYSGPMTTGTRAMIPREMSSAPPSISYGPSPASGNSWTPARPSRSLAPRGGPSAPLAARSGTAPAPTRGGVGPPSSSVVTPPSYHATPTFTPALPAAPLMTTGRAASPPTIAAQTFADRRPGRGAMPLPAAPAATRMGTGLQIQRAGRGTMSAMGKGGAPNAKAESDSRITSRENGNAAAEVELLATEVYTMLKRRLQTEAERRGRW